MTNIAEPTRLFGPIRCSWMSCADTWWQFFDVFVYIYDVIWLSRRTIYYNHRKCSFCNDMIQLGDCCSSFTVYDLSVEVTLEPTMI